MVLWYPGKLLQIVFKPVAWSKKPIYGRRAPPWAANPDALRPAQAAQCARLAEVASRHYGEKGFIGGLPVIAAYVQTEAAGAILPPEETAREKTRRLRHERVPQTIEKLRRKAGEYAVRAGVGPAGAGAI